MLNSIAWCQPSIPDSVYCLPIGKARLALQDAARLRVVIAERDTLETRVILLESQQLASYHSFTNLLRIEQDKYTLQKETTADVWKIATSYKQEMDSEKKKVKGLKWQRGGLAGALVFVVILSLTGQ